MPENALNTSTQPLAEDSAPKKSLGTAFIATMGTSVGIIILSLVSGILTARFLGTEGRGAVAAVTSWTLTITWASTLGFAISMVYHQSKGVAADRILGTSLAVMPVLGALGVGVAQILIPMGFAAQTEATRDLARIFLCTIPLVLLAEAMWDLLMAAQRFVTLGIMRLLQPLSFVLALLALVGLDRSEPFWVLAAQAMSYAVSLIATVIALAQRGIARPDFKLARGAFGYGLRVHSGSFGSIVATRLDLMLLPAFVGAAALGYYSIAVNLASMVVSLFGSLGKVVLPVSAASDQQESVRVIERGLRINLVGGGIVVAGLAVTAPWLVPFVYGADFSGSVHPLWLMLPGILLWSASSVTTAGLQGMGMPGTASLTQVAGFLVTVAGLAWSLPKYGIIGAAVTSSVAYTVIFALTYVALRRRCSISLRRSLSIDGVSADVAWARDRVARLSRKGR